MKLPEIDRDLRDSDPKVRYHLMRQAEEIITLKQEMHEAAKLLVHLVEAHNKLHKINIELNERWERMRRGESEPSMVESVLPEREN